VMLKAKKDARLDLRVISSRWPKVCTQYVSEDYF
jgi:hypothetical protein